MMRSRPNPDTVEDEPLDPAIQAELDQLDAALRGEPIEDDLLATLVRDVQATAPEMPADLRKQLRHDITEGFAKGGARGKLSAVLGRTGQRSTAPVRRRTSLLYGGGLAATLVVLVGVGSIGVLSQTGGDDAMTVSETAAPPAASAPSGTEQSNSYQRGSTSEPEIDLLSNGPDAAPASGGGSESATAIAPQSSTAKSSDQDLADTVARAPQDNSRTRQSSSAGAATGSTPATGTRRVEQTVDMSVEVKSGKLPEATSKVEDIVRLGRGYVSDSQVNATGTRGAGSATYRLKVASSELDRTLKRLADLGTVTSQQQASRDITSSFDSVQARLDDNKKVRQALLRSLAKATTDGQIASLNRRLADNRGTRERLENQLAGLRTRTNLTDVSLTLSAPSGDAPEADDDGSWSLGDAVSDAGQALGTVTGVLLVGAAVLLPFGLLAAVAWALYRVRRKRRRESALDG